jgi:hypothetical protein
MTAQKLDLFEFAAKAMADPRPLQLWSTRWGFLSASEISRRRNAQRKSERQVLDEKLLYCSLLGPASFTTGFLGACPRRRPSENNGENGLIRARNAAKHPADEPGHRWPYRLDGRRFTTRRRHA